MTFFHIFLDTLPIANIYHLLIISYRHHIEVASSFGKKNECMAAEAVL